MDLTALGVAVLAGLHTSTWGMYKDAPHEGFTWRKYFRSTVVAAFAGILIQWLVAFDLSRWSEVAVFFGTVYVVERALTEFYKTFLRVEDQSKYFIPMQFSVFGNVVESRPVQLGVGFAYLLSVLLIGYAAWRFEQTDPDLPALLVVVTFGAIGGWISAFGGAWKDAPKEGFETLKFFRSPAFTAAWAFLLAHFTASYLLLAMAALGYTIATIETYKTFFFPSKPRGKFAGMPVTHPEMLTRRTRFVPVYVAIWLFVITAFVLGFRGPHQGLF